MERLAKRCSFFSGVVALLTVAGCGGSSGGGGGGGDTTPPDPPVITSPLDGSSTFISTPTIKGTAEPGCTVEIFDGTTSLGTALADSDGAWSFTPETALKDGFHTFTAVAIDAAGNESQPSDPVTIGIDAPPAPPVITSPPNGLLTNDPNPTIQGTAEPNCAVEIFDGIVDKNWLGMVIVDQNGNWSFTVVCPLIGGLHTFTAIARDGAGSVSEPSEPVSIVLDIAPPQAPAITSPESGEATNASTITIAGTARVNDAFLVKVFAGTTLLGTVIPDSSGNWSLEVTLEEDTYVLTAKALDVVGNESIPSSPVIITVDFTPPDPPIITSPANGSATNNDTFAIIGNAEPYSTVTVFDSGDPIDTVQATSSGNWSLGPLQFNEGNHTFSAVATDAAGNTSNLSSAVTVAIDLTKPDAPVISSPADGSATNDNTPTISGTAEPNSTVEVFEGSSSLGTTQADEDGNWSFTLSSSLTDGSYTFTATATDAAGNESDPSSVVTVMVDTVPPGNMAAPTDDGDNTNDNTVKFRWQPALDNLGGSGIDVYELSVRRYRGANSSEIGSYTVAALEYEITDSGAQTGDVYKAMVRARDKAGNYSPAWSPESDGITYNPDVPGKVTDLTANPPGPWTNQTSITYSWTAPSSSQTITGYQIHIWGANVSEQTISQGALTNYTYTSGADGQVVYVAVRAVSLAGSGEWSEPYGPINIDTTPPSAPPITSPPDNSVTNDTTPTISGTAEANSTVTVLDDGELIGTTVADGSGNWNFTPSDPLSEGLHVIAATATDVAGNTGPPSTVTIRIDLTPPGAPEIKSPEDGSSVLPPFHIVGASEPYATIKVYHDLEKPVLLGYTSADQDGFWDLCVDKLLFGNYVFFAVAFDAAGNESDPSEPVRVTVEK